MSKKVKCNTWIDEPEPIKNNGGDKKNDCSNKPGSIVGKQIERDNKKQ